MKYLIYEIGMPAIKGTIGYKIWYFKGKAHRINGLTGNYYPSKVHNLYGRRIILNICKLII